jgi:hypothetical protein
MSKSRLRCGPTTRARTSRATGSFEAKITASAHPRAPARRGPRRGSRVVRPIVKARRAGRWTVSLRAAPTATKRSNSQRRLRSVAPAPAVAGVLGQ